MGGTEINNIEEGNSKEWSQQLKSQLSRPHEKWTTRSIKKMQKYIYTNAATLKPTRGELERRILKEAIDIINASETWQKGGKL